MVLLVLFAVQLLFIKSTSLMVTVSVFLIVALAATLGWLVMAMKRDNDGVTGLWSGNSAPEFPEATRTENLRGIDSVKSVRI